MHLSDTAQLSRWAVPFAALLALAGAASNALAQDNPVAVESLTDTTAEPQRPLSEQGRARQLDTEVAFQAPVVPDASGLEEEYQIQLLQQEVSGLRGLIEELKHAVDMTKRLSDERYLELDSRFQALREGLDTRPSVPAAAASAGLTQSDARPGLSSQTGSDAAPDATEGATEQALYDTALELIRNRQYDVAISQLQAVISQYPEGDLAPNAYYWLGEVYAAMPEPNFEEARQALAQVITFFPEHSKVPAAAFKLGKVYHLMGDCARALETLEGVIAANPGKSVGKLAEAYLRDKVNCERPD